MADIPEGGAGGRFAALLEEYGRLLRATIADLCPRGSGIDRADIEQEACLRLWRALSAEREILHPASYIYRVAVSATVDAVRRVRARHEEVSPRAEGEAVPDGDGGALADPGDPPDVVAERRLMLTKIRAETEQLAGDGGQAVRLHLQGFTTTEVGHLLGCSEARARNLVYRGLAEIRRRLGAPGGEDDAT